MDNVVVESVILEVVTTAELMVIVVVFLGEKINRIFWMTKRTYKFIRKTNVSKVQQIHIRR